MEPTHVMRETSQDGKPRLAQKSKQVLRGVSSRLGIFAKAGLGNVEWETF